MVERLLELVAKKRQVFGGKNGGKKAEPGISYIIERLRLDLSHFISWVVLFFSPTGDHSIFQFILQNELSPLSLSFSQFMPLPCNCVNALSALLQGHKSECVCVS